MQSGLSTFFLACIAACCLFATCSYGIVPEKQSWLVSSSADQAPEFPDKYICDNKTDTRWSTPGSDPQWIQIDLTTNTVIAGVRILWETAYAKVYHIDVAYSTAKWQRVYATDSGNGRTDYVFFTPATARYIRITGTMRGTGWGYSIWEIDVLDANHAPHISTQPAGDENISALFSGHTNDIWRSSQSPSTELTFDFGAPLSIGGIRIIWGTVFACDVRMETSIDGTQWEEQDHIQDGTGGFDVCMHPQKTVRFIRLTLQNPSRPDAPIEIRECTLRGPDEDKTPLAMYQLAAHKAPPGMYPLWLRMHQTYWTIIGLPADTEESLLDEYGMLEPHAGAQSITPFIYVNNSLYSAAAANVTHSLYDGFLPVPSVIWTTQFFGCEIDACAGGAPGNSATFTRYCVTNTTSHSLTGTFFLAIRPIQVNPSWQHGGLAPVQTISLTHVHDRTDVYVNGAHFYSLFSSVDMHGACAFDRGDITEYIRRNTVPPMHTVHDNSEYASGALGIHFVLPPGETFSVIGGAPMHDSAEVLRPFIHENETPAVAWEKLYTKNIQQWRSFFDAPSFSVNDKAVTDTLKSQIAYILINRDGIAIQPGSRNYKRCWIRDGCLTSAALLRYGMTNAVRRYLEWYAKRVQPDGWVPPILENTGEINKGYGWNLEYDSQGQFIYALMEYYRFTHDKSFIRAHFHTVTNALHFLEKLHIKTSSKDYMADAPVPERFHGILPPSHSHEGYNPPMHSYWDDFWALKGWKDGRKFAQLCGEKDVANWAQKNYTTFRVAVATSLYATIRWKKMNVLPGCADKGDIDPTSTAIGIFPCNEIDIINTQYMHQTFDLYYSDLMARTNSSWEGAFTPYELRCIMAFIALGQPTRAQDLLAYMMTCRRPPAWNHLAEVVHSDPRRGIYIGDMPHTWVGSGFVNSVRGMCIWEHDDLCELLPGVPLQWCKEHGVTLKNMPTWYGSLTLTARYMSDTFTVTLEGIAPPKGYILHVPRDEKPLSLVINDKEFPIPHTYPQIRLGKEAHTIILKWQKYD